MKSTTRFTKNKKGIECLNCKQPISDNDNFCSNCGQVNDELPLSIKQFISEFFSGFFSFDTRFFNTFMPLLFKPGRVSKDYIEGKRRRYVNPFQLYLHVTIVFFLLQGLLSVLDEYKISGTFLKNDTKISSDSIINQANKTLNQVEEDLAASGIHTNLPVITANDSINEEIADSIFKKYNLPNFKKSEKDSVIKIAKLKIQNLIDSIFKNTNILEQLNSSAFTNIQKDSIFDQFQDSILINITKTLENSENKLLKITENITKLQASSISYIEKVFTDRSIIYVIPLKHRVSIEDKIILQFFGQALYKKISSFIKYDKNNNNSSVYKALDTLGYEKSRGNIFYYKKAQDYNKFKNDAEFRKSYLDDIISKISIALFFMLPIFTAFISLLYIRHKKNYTEHLVFVFNIQTVFFLLLIFFTLFDKIFKTDIGIGLFLIFFLFYLYKSIRNFYKQNRFKSIFKFFMLNTIFITLSTVGLLIISFLTFAL